MIEFDVLPEDLARRATRAGCCSRTTTSTASRDAPTLEEGLDHLASAPFAGLELDVDLKLPGYEERVVRRAARARPASSARWSPRSTCAASSRSARSSRGCGSAGRSRACARDYTRSTLYALPALGAAALMAPPACPASPPATSRDGRVDALMAHCRLVTPRLVRGGRAAPAASSTSGRSTTPAHIRRLEALGVTGVITNDPRLFASA